MKRIKSFTLNVKKIITLLLLSLMQTALWAQDGGGADVNVKITKDNGNWYAQPWVWVVGAAVFIIILVALFRSSSSKNTEVTRSSTTVIKD